MTLDEMLALLPDNGSGEISAADLRDIVTGLWARASRFAQSFSYQWTTATSPAGGRINLDQGWSPSSTQLWLSETTNDGQVLDFVMFDNANAAEIWLTTQAGALWHGKVAVLPTTDSGGYRTVVMTVVDVSGPPPVANDKVAVNVILTVADSVT